MAVQYSVIIQQAGAWWIGWVKEVPGVNSQGRTRKELLDNLRDALEEALEMRQAEGKEAGDGSWNCFEKISGSISDETAFLEALEFGRAFRYADRPADEPREQP